MCKRDLVRGHRHEWRADLYDAAQPEDKLTSIERTFITYWRQVTRAQGLDLPDPVHDYQFDDTRGWKIDWSWPGYQLAVELNGAGGGGFGRAVKCQRCGATVRARKKDGSPGKVLLVPYASHASGDQMERDAEKSNALTAQGWKVLTFTSKQLKDQPAQCIELAAGLLIEAMGLEAVEVISDNKTYSLDGKV